MSPQRTTLRETMLEESRIIWKNLEGRETPFNRLGDRNFCVVLNPDLAEAMKSEGWNVRVREPKDPDDDRLYYLTVKVKFGKYPPKIALISSKGQRHLDEDTAKLVDTADIHHVDLLIRPYAWEMNKQHGITAYLKSMYVTLREDPLEAKYRDVPSVVPSEPPFDLDDD